MTIEKSNNINIKENTLESMVIKDSMKNLINFTFKASVKNYKAFPHTIITGPPGTGKTSLAFAIVQKHLDYYKGVTYRTELINGAVTNKANSSNVMQALLEMRKGGVLIIDEIHALPTLVCEALYPLFDYGELFVGGGKVKIENVTIIGCTTDPQKVPAPLMDRLTFKLRLGNYTENEMVNILRGRVTNGLKYDDAALVLISKVSRLVPRISIQNLTNMNNFAIANNFKVMNRDRVVEALSLMGIDENGLTEEDKTVLEIVAGFYPKAASLGDIVAMLNMDPVTYRNTVEVNLIANGFIRKSNKGRELTQKALDLLYG